MSLALSLWASVTPAAPGWFTGSFEERLAAVRHAGEADAVDLENFLAAKPEGAGVDQSELATIKNEAATVLLALPHVSPTLATRLLDMAGDPQTEVIWRDYCVQFLGIGFPKWSTDDAGRVAEFLLKVAAQDKGSTGGTALIALCNNVDAASIGRDRVVRLTLAAVREKSSGDALRITALQVCGQLRATEALPDARTIAASASPVRASAIAAIGSLGDRSDISRLRVLTQVPDRTCRQAALNAMKIIQHRETSFEKE